jgi:hypothetical protein
MGEEVRLNLGSGETPIDGYTNIDRKQGQEVYPLKCADNSVDEIRASHVLEHFSHGEVFPVVFHWMKKLKVGGVMKIAVPDLLVIAELLIHQVKAPALGYLYGGQTDANDYHHTGFTPTGLWQVMQAAGLERIEKWESKIQDCANLKVSLNIQGTKLHDWQDSPLANLSKVKLVALMSMPRLAFTDNMFSSMRGLLPYTTEFERGTGVYWEQILTRLMEKRLKDGTEWIVVCDYDTWFQKEHVLRLMQLMATNTEADAICPVQIQRQGDYPLVSKKADDGTQLGVVPISEFEKPLTSVTTGHFALTMFRVSSLKKLKKPWFMPQADPNGGWGEGRHDADISFWLNWKESGLTLFQANEVCVGHLQQICTFPGTLANAMKPYHQFMSELEGKPGPPPHVIPTVSIVK